MTADILITAPTKRLQQFAIRYAQDTAAEDAFAGPTIILQRKK